MSHFRYTHTASITFTGGKTGCFDPACIVDNVISRITGRCNVFFPDKTGFSKYTCSLKGDTTLLIHSIHFGGDASKIDGAPFLLRLGGEYDKRPNDVAIDSHGHIVLPNPLPLPSRMGFYLSIPDGVSVMLVGTAASVVPDPKEPS